SRDARRSPGSWATLSTALAPCSRDALRQRALRRTKLGHDIGEAKRSEVRAHDHDDVDVRRKQLAGRTERLANQALGAIALHRAPDLARRRDPEPRSVRVVRIARGDDQDEVRQREPLTAALDLLVLAALLDPSARRKGAPGLGARRHAYFL